MKHVLLDKATKPFANGLINSDILEQLRSVFKEESE